MSYGPLGHTYLSVGVVLVLVVAGEGGNIIASKSSVVREVVTARQIKVPMGLFFSIPITWWSLRFGGNAAQKILLQSITSRVSRFVSILPLHLYYALRLNEV